MRVVAGLFALAGALALAVIGILGWDTSPPEFFGLRSGQAYLLLAALVLVFLALAAWVAKRRTN